MEPVEPPDALAKPRPVPTPTSQPYWDALNDDRIVLQRCADCSTWVHYPRRRCTTCLSDHLVWTEVDGVGTLFTFSVAHAPTATMFADEVPLVIAVVELPQGVHLTTTIVTDDPAALRCGDEVVPVFDHGDDGLTLLRHRPANLG